MILRPLEPDASLHRQGYGALVKFEWVLAHEALISGGHPLVIDEADFPGVDFVCGPCAFPFEVYPRVGW